MLGLFMIMPVFAIYGTELTGFSPALMGLAIGAYGLTQAMLQIPMGWLSDRVGRKPVILGGLAVFALGSFIAAGSDSIYGVIFGRTLQGAGAIASAIMALAADASREQHRTKVMAVIGMCIGLSFVVALVLGPVLAPYIGLSGLFVLTGVLALLAMVMVARMVPTVVSKAPSAETVARKGHLRRMLKDPQLVRLDFGIFVLHMVMTALFVALPLQLLGTGVPAEKHAWFYLPIMLGSFVLMVPMIITASRTGQQKRFFQLALVLLMLAVLMLAFSGESLVWLVLAVLVYFTAFNFLEASLPAMLSMAAPVGNKGSAMGVYSSSQFFGAFLGGALGGVLYQQLGTSGLYACLLALLLVWFILSFGLSADKPLKSHALSVKLKNQEEAEQLALRLVALSGVSEAVVVMEEQAAYLKVERDFEIDQAIDMLRR